MSEIRPRLTINGIDVPVKTIDIFLSPKQAPAFGKPLLTPTVPVVDITMDEKKLALLLAKLFKVPKRG